MDYIVNSDDPMIEEFCYTNGVNKDTIYRLEKENQNLSDSIKACHVKQHIRTVRLIESGTINPTFGIFKLKQKCYGWTDKQEIEQVNVNVEAELTEEEADAILKKYDIRR
jgi:hypothetical protein